MSITANTQWDLIEKKPRLLWKSEIFTLSYVTSTLVRATEQIPQSILVLRGCDVYIGLLNKSEIIDEKSPV